MSDYFYEPDGISLFLIALINFFKRLEINLKIFSIQIIRHNREHTSNAINSEVFIKDISC
jgi:hypothetical protein